MTEDPDFPEALRGFIREHIPDVDAAELLLELARDPAREYDVPSLLAELAPTALSDAIARKHLAVFEERGVVAESAGRFRYAPPSREVDDCVQALMRVYNERPVTMV